MEVSSLIPREADALNRGTLKEKQSFLMFLGLGWRVGERGRRKEEVPSSTQAPLYTTDGVAKKNREGKAGEGSGGGALQAGLQMLVTYLAPGRGSQLFRDPDPSIA